MTTEILDAAGIRKLVPQLGPDYVRGVHVLDQGYVANPERLVKSLAAKFQQEGGTIVQRKVLDIETGEGGVTALLTDAGRMPVETLVVCAGVHSGELAAKLGEPVPIEAERGYHVTYSDPGLQLPLPVHVSDAKVFVTPMEMGVRVAGQAEFAGIYADPNYQRADVLETHMKRMFPQVHTGDSTRWMGRRPAMPDSLPVIGPSVKQKNVYYAFGHGHLGLCGGAPTGRLIADLVGSRRPAIDLTPFRVDRFYERTVARLHDCTDSASESRGAYRLILSRVSRAVSRIASRWRRDVLRVFADFRIASNTATPCASSPPATASGRFAAAARAKCSSSARSVLTAGKVTTCGWWCTSRFCGSTKQVFICHVVRCSTSPTSTQPLEPKTCMRHVSAVAMTVPR